MVRIVVLADTHIPAGAASLPVQVMEGLAGADTILHAGDIVVPRVLDELEVFAPVHAVRGNMDSPQLYQRLPEKKIIKVGSLRIGLVHGHGTGQNALQRAQTTFKNSSPHVVVFGHSHWAYNQKHRGVLYFNPGSPTSKRGSPTHSYGLLHIDGMDVKGEIIKF